MKLLPADFRYTPEKTRASIGLILFCAEQGFAGAFSERVLNDAGADLANATIFLIGTRGLVVARERGLNPSWSVPMVSHVDAVPSLANNVADALYAQIANGTLSTIEMIAPRSTSGAGVRIERHSLLPLDLARFASASETLPPLTTLKPSGVARTTHGRVRLCTTLRGSHAFL